MWWAPGWAALEKESVHVESEGCNLDFGQVDPTPISKIFGQKIHLETNMIKKISKFFRPNTNTRVICGPKIN